MPEKYFSLATVVLFEILLAIDVCVDSGVMKMKRQSPYCDACFKTVGRMWLILVLEGVEKLPGEVSDRAGRVPTTVESSTLIPQEITISALPKSSFTV